MIDIVHAAAIAEIGIETQVEVDLFQSFVDGKIEVSVAPAAGIDGLAHLAAKTIGGGPGADAVTGETIM